MSTEPKTAEDARRELLSVAKAVYHATAGMAGVLEAATRYNNDAMVEQMSAEMRDGALAFALHLRGVVRHYIGPVWELVPPEVRAACEEAGVFNDGQ